MLKYRNQHTHKPETLLSTIFSFLQVGLVLVGLVGLSVHLFEDKGWLKQWLGSLMRTEIVHTAIGAVLLLIAGYLLKGWMHSGDEKRQSQIADAMLYLMMIVGGFFIFRLITEGSL
ncbi:MAG TPA: hypothetical protein VGK14_11730 [Novimethylophilus sp.]|jgi:hypothetical protein|uniref:hypothetical protein n=1 Tax=Novimethylophilus sp. TaxID=2137426 RepID=UPI002F3F5A84